MARGCLCVCVCVCVGGKCISDQAGEYLSIHLLDEEINMSDVVADEKSSRHPWWMLQLIFYLATVTLTNSNWLGDQK